MNFKIPIYLLLGVIFLCEFPKDVLAQKKKNIETETCNRIFNFEFQYTYQMPQGYLASRFGNVHSASFGGIIKSKGNWMYGFDATYQFGTEVNNETAQNILINLSNSTGTISNSSGSPGMVILGERGFNVLFKGGKLINLSKNSPNSGLAFILGIGFLSHKISITTPENNVPTLSDELKKGYDRLSMGFAMSQFVGYYFQGKNRMTNFYVGLDITEGFTTNTRGFNYDSRQPDTGSHFDVFIGPKFCWMIPVYLASKNQDEFIYK